MQASKKTFINIQLILLLIPIFGALLDLLLINIYLAKKEKGAKAFQKWLHFLKLLIIILPTMIFLRVLYEVMISKHYYLYYLISWIMLDLSIILCIKYEIKYINKLEEFEKEDEKKT